MKKVPKDKLSSDMPEVTRHRWNKGTWIKNTSYVERIDTCIFCDCKRHVIKFWLNGIMFTQISSYERSGISFGAEHRPECWRGKEPK